MKKFLMFLFYAFLAMLTACANPNIPQRQKPERPEDIVIPMNSEEPGFSEQKGEGETKGGGGFVLLSDANAAFSNHFGTEQGYYRFTESQKIANGLYGRHLTYIDYAQREEVYLCSDSACLHDSATCSSVFLDDEFGRDPLLFVWEETLYVLGREYDDDGTVVVFEGGDGGGKPDMAAPALYRMELDGSDRKKIYTFPQDTVVEKLVFGSEDALWFVIKEPVFEQEGNQAYTLAKERRLCKYCIAENKMTEDASLDFGDNSQYEVIGGHGSLLVLSSVVYPNGMSERDVMRLDDDEWREVWQNSSTIYSTFDVAAQEKKEIYRTDNKEMSYCAVRGGMLFIANSVSGEITRLNLDTGEQSVLASLKQNYIYYVLGDTLCCVSTEDVNDKSLYFVNMESGEVKRSTLTNLSLGWELDILAETEQEVLVIYDYDAKDNGDGSYEILQYKYALISKEDLYNSVAGYKPVTMLGRGR